MTKKEFWLKLFSENDIALASAIHLCERFVDEEQLENGKDFIAERRKELYEEIPEAEVARIFPSLVSSEGRTCKDCEHFIGGGDWNLCCSAEHPTPEEKKKGMNFPCGFLCYEDTEACDLFQEKN